MKLGQSKGYVPTNKGQKLPPEVLTRNEVKLLLNACSRRAPSGVRNRALIALMYRGMLRVSEALDLKAKDLDRGAGTVRVLHGKGNKARTVALDDTAFGLVDSWLAAREKRGLNGHHRLISTLKGKPVDSAYVRNLLKRLARKVGIHKRVHPHGLRHTGASEMRGEGIDIGVISKQLGHSSISTTARYLDHLSPQTVIDAVRGRQWEV